MIGGYVPPGLSESKIIQLKLKCSDVFLNMKRFSETKIGVRVFLLLKISIIFDYTIFHCECGHFVSHFLFGPGWNLKAELSFKKNFSYLT